MWHTQFVTLQAPFLKRVLLPPSAGEGYPFSVPLVRRGFDLHLTKPVTLICGENGSGKSTLIESLALHCGFSITGGSRNHNLGTENVDIGPLQDRLTFSWSVKVSSGFFVRAESFFHFSNVIDDLARQPGGEVIYDGYGGSSLHAQSHGEGFLSLFTHQLGRKGIYILDEPEAALSPQRQLALLRIIHELARTGQAQFIIATHSPMLMATPEAALLYIHGDEIAERNFRETPHFQVMARFFADPEDYVASVLKD